MEEGKGDGAGMTASGKAVVKGIKRDNTEVLSSYSGERRGGGWRARVTRAWWQSCRACHTNKASRILANGTLFMLKITLFLKSKYLNATCVLL